MNKVQLTLTNPEAEILQLKADKFGYDLARYVKFLISKAVEQSIDDVPTFHMSEKMEKRYDEAMGEYKKGNSIELKDIDDLDKLLI
jgi:hypothetical protein